MTTYSDYLAANGPTGLTGLDVSNWIRDAGLSGNSGVAANALVSGLLGAQSADREAFGNRANEYLADMAKQFGHPVTEADLQNPAFYNDPKNQAIFNAMAERGNRYAGGSFWGDALGGALRVAAAAYGMNSAFPGVGDVTEAVSPASSLPEASYDPTKSLYENLNVPQASYPGPEGSTPVISNEGIPGYLNPTGDFVSSSAPGLALDGIAPTAATATVGSKIADALKSMASNKGALAALTSLATTPTEGAVPKLGIPQTDSTSGIASGQGSSGQTSNASSGQASQAQQIAQQLATPVFPVIQDQKSFKVSDLYPSAMLNSQEPTSNQVMNMAGSTWNPQMLAAALRG